MCSYAIHTYFVLRIYVELGESKSTTTAYVLLSMKNDEYLKISTRIERFHDIKISMNAYKYQIIMSTIRFYSYF